MAALDVHSPMPVIGGARSETTLIRFMLDADPDLAVLPETGYLAGDPALPYKLPLSNGS